MTHHPLAVIGLGVALFGLAACANPYEIRYLPNPQQPAEAVERSDGPPLFRPGTDPVLDSIDMRDGGYALLGQAYYNSPGKEIMEKQAAQAGAAEVILYKRHEFRNEDRDSGFGVGVGVGVGSGSVSTRSGIALGSGGIDREFPDPAPGYRYLATYWAKSQQATPPAERTP